MELAMPIKDETALPAATALLASLEDDMTLQVFRDEIDYKLSSNS